MLARNNDRGTGQLPVTVPTATSLDSDSVTTDQGTDILDNLRLHTSAAPALLGMILLVNSFYQVVCSIPGVADSNFQISLPSGRLGCAI